MTEAEWLDSYKPQALLEFLGLKISERKQRLFAAACCRPLLPLISDERLRNAVKIAEQLADGCATTQETHIARVAAREAWHVATGVATYAPRAVQLALSGRIKSVRLSHLHALGALTWTVSHWAAAEHTAQRSQSTWVRCIFGNPFRAVTFNRSWLSHNVVALAQTIYTDRAFDRLPILADALEDAGCDNADILNHCRQPGEHVRGCWVVDVILGKS
jgi:hypothetical protein